MKYYLIKIKDNKSPVGKICLEMSCTPYGVELTEEELEFIKVGCAIYDVKIGNKITDKIRKVLDNER